MSRESPNTGCCIFEILCLMCPKKSEAAGMRSQHVLIHAQPAAKGSQKCVPAFCIRRTGAHVASDLMLIAHRKERSIPT